jgi:hypothetical protein
MDLLKIFKFGKDKLPPTPTTTDSGYRLSGKLVLYLEYLANRNNGINLVPNPM